MSTRRIALMLLSLFALVQCTAPAVPPTPSVLPITNPTTPVRTTSPNTAKNMHNLIPKPSTVIPAQGVFVLNPTTKIVADPSNEELTRIGELFAASLRPGTGFPLSLAQDTNPDNTIRLALVHDDSLGEEGYLLSITPASVVARANKPAGLYYAAQTLRQLLPPSAFAGTEHSGPWEIAAGTIRDVPRFAWRGTMLDVSRHFFPVAVVKRFIDAISAYKINRLHLHLSDDQGWRIEIKSWDRLASFGGSTEVGGGPGGFYTQEEYSDLVQYAAERYIMIIPEIDMPGHTNAALASYPELNCSDTAPAVYTGTEVGFSTLCVDKEITYKFVDDVVRELATLTPGPYIHIGGDEARSTPDEEYVRFVERVRDIVVKNGKQVLGWEEIGQTRLAPGTVAQHWTGMNSVEAAAQGAQVIMSPASKAYLDMKYDASFPLGLDWAGLVDVVTAYSWEPTTQAEGIATDKILGVEAPLWSETLTTLQDIETMAFPRLIGIAEIGWSPPDGRSWEEYRVRLASHGPRLRALGISYYAAPEVDWE